MQIKCDGNLHRQGRSILDEEPYILVLLFTFIPYHFDIF